MGRLLLVGLALVATRAKAGEADAGEASSGMMEVEAFEEVPAPDAGAAAAIEQFAAPSTAPTVKLFGSVEGTLAVDTVFESPRNVELAENVWDAQARVRLGADIKVFPWLRLFIEGKAWVRGGSQREFDRAKATFEPMLGEAFVDLYSSRVDLRIGNQRIVLGANAALAPADALNPRDYRIGFLSQDPDNAVLPVFAIRAQGELGKVSWMAAYAPFFTPSRFALYGQDQGFLQPALAPALPTRRLDPSVEDRLQETALETKRPAPFVGDLAVRVVSTGRFKIGASWAWINEKLPQVTIDSELQTLLASQGTGRPVDPAVAVSVKSRLAAGQQLFRGVYLRQNIFSAEGSTLIGPGQLDVDLSFSPRQTFFDANFAPINKPAVTWVVGYSTAQDSAWLWGLSYLGMAVPDISANEQILLLEPATAVGAPRTAFFHLIAGNLSYRFWKDRFVAELRAAFEPIQQSFTVSPTVTWQGVDRLKIWLAAEFYEGSPYSPLGYFGRNDQILLGARYEFF